MKTIREIKEWITRHEMSQIKKFNEINKTIQQLHKVDKELIELKIEEMQAELEDEQADLRGQLRKEIIVEMKIWRQDVESHMKKTKKELKQELKNELKNEESMTSKKKPRKTFREYLISKLEN